MFRSKGNSLAASKNGVVYSYLLKFFYDTSSNLMTLKFLSFPALAMSAAFLTLTGCEQTIYQPFPIGEGYRFHQPVPREPVRPDVADELDRAFEERWRNVANQVALQILNDTRGIVDSFYMAMPENPGRLEILLDFYLREAFTNMDFTVLTRPTEGVIVRPYVDAPSDFSYKGVPEEKTREEVLKTQKSGGSLFDREQEVVIGYIVDDNGIILAETNSRYVVPVMNPGEYLPREFRERYDY